MHRHRPFLFAAAALALSGALAHPTLTAQNKAVALPGVPRFYPGGIFGGPLPRNWRNPWRYRTKPKTTTAREKRRALKRRNVLRERARR